MKLLDKIFKNNISTETTEDELNLVKAINTTNLSGNFSGIPVSNLYYDFLGSKLTEYYDLWMIFTTLQKVFNRMFEWNGLSKKQARLMEELLFKNGKVALVKTKILEEDLLIISNFNIDDDTMRDIYGYPSKIRLICPKNVFDNKVITKDFAVIYNNSTYSPTLLYVWKRILEFIKTINKLDKAIETGDVKIPFSDGAGSDKADEMNRMWYTDKIFINVNGEFLRNNPINPITLENNATNKMELLMFMLDFVNMFLGFKTQNMINKKERETEAEISNNDKFNGLIIKDMYNMREEGAEEIKERLDMAISIKEPEIMEQKVEINGEENKNKLENENV